MLLITGTGVSGTPRARQSFFDICDLWHDLLDESLRRLIIVYRAILIVLINDHRTHGFKVSKKDNNNKCIIIIMKIRSNFLIQSYRVSQLANNEITKYDHINIQSHATQREMPNG